MAKIYFSIVVLIVLYLQLDDVSTLKSECIRNMGACQLNHEPCIDNTHETIDWDCGTKDMTCCIKRDLPIDPFSYDDNWKKCATMKKMLQTPSEKCKKFPESCPELERPYIWSRKLFNLAQNCQISNVQFTEEWKDPNGGRPVEYKPEIKKAQYNPAYNQPQSRPGPIQSQTPTQTGSEKCTDFCQFQAKANLANPQNKREFDGKICMCDKWGRGYYNTVN